jgi:apolipoprotein D and lipocalin family protein
MRLPAPLRLVLLALLGLLGGCVSRQPFVPPVTDFDLDRYLGTWYEIARLDHSRVSADYTLREDGGVRVQNRGFNAAKNRWQEAEGRAYFVLDPNTAYLKVSFFGPFYGAYIVTELDPDYRHVLVSGPNHDYLWILARTPQLETAVRDRLVARAKALGFATDQLIWVEH